ncbi:MAG: enolase C-terminal domain-like protein, partial [Acidimicrobiales bacterium]
VLDRHLVPRLLAGGVGTGAGVGPALAAVKGHQMAKSALELAVLDAELRARGVSLARHLAGASGSGGDPAGRVAAGVAVGIAGTVDALVAEVGRWVAQHYRRVKLKIRPGWDVGPAAAVRAAWPDLLVGVDANGSYGPGVAARAPAGPGAPAAPEGLAAPARLEALEALDALDHLGLSMIEQPLGDDDLVGHAALARRLRTPVCLDEPITSAAVAEAALELGAASVINVKAARVGGYLEAVRVHDVCRARGVPVWCGGMVETGIGRAANLALASLPSFTIPGDLSGSDRWWAADIVTPELGVEADGTIAVPRGPGIGVEVRAGAVDAAATWRRWYRAAAK